MSTQTYDADDELAMQDLRQRMIRELEGYLSYAMKWQVLARIIRVRDPDNASVERRYNNASGQTPVETQSC